MAESHLFIWDGECGFCKKFVDWMQSMDVDHRFTAVPFQSCPSPPMTPDLYERSRRAVQILTDDGQRLSGGRAILFSLEQVGWHPRLTRLGQRPPFSWPIEVGYWVVARNRPFFSRILFRPKRS